MGALAYAVTNQLTGLGGTVFTWSNATTTNRDYVNDGRLDKPQVIGATVASGINVIVDLGSAKQLVGVAVLNSNCAVQKTDATLKVEASSTSGFTSDINVAKAASTLYSSTVPRNKDHVVQFTANFTKRYWRLTWTWTGNVTNFQIGELFFYTAAIQLSRRSVYGSGETEDALIAQSQMQYGETRALFMAGPIRQVDLQWDDLTSSQRDELRAMHQTSNYGATPLLWIGSYEATAVAAATTEQDVIYGRIAKPGFSFAEKDFSLYQPAGFSIRSLGREAGA